MNITFDVKHLSEDMKIIYIYRYISLIIISIFYMIDNKTWTIIMKLFMMLCLAASSVIFNYIYGIIEHLEKMRILFITIEVIGNILILIPTGGLDSPFIWYSLNSILISIYFYNIHVSFLLLIIYEISSSLISQLIFSNNKLSLFQLLSNHSNLLLSFILIIIAAELLINQTKNLNLKSKELLSINDQLSITNSSLKNSMEQIMKLYQAVYSFASLDNRDKLVELLINYTKEITKSSLIILCTMLKNEAWETKTRGNISDSFKEEIINKLRDKWNEIKVTELPVLLSVSSKKLMVAPLNSATRFYGILAIELKEDESEIDYMEKKDQMRFLSSLSSSAFEKVDLEELKRQLLINEEQNRIANEIHDSISQRLFAVSCSVYEVIRKTKDMVPEKIGSDLNNIKDSLNETIKELRKTIYGMSWNKWGISVFQTSIKKYTNDISKLYSANILFNMYGSEELINSVLKKALYRIICEGVGNSARHGKSKTINVSLNIEISCIKLVISDDGIGFEMSSVKDNSGIGMKNINDLIYSLEGKVEIKSEIGHGTKLIINLPNKKIKSEDMMTV